MLEPVKHCIEIPKEVCAKSRINPVRRKKPVVRKWCLNKDEDNGNDDGVSTIVLYGITWDLIKGTVHVPTKIFVRPEMVAL